MNHILARLIWLAAIALAPMTGGAAELKWFTDYEKAQTQANAEGKAVLLFFHASDWCPPCIRMQREVFNAPEFAAYARSTLVLVDVDFPERIKQNDALKQANLALKKRFNVSQEWGQGFPSIVLLNDVGETMFQERAYAGGLGDVMPDRKSVV